MSNQTSLQILQLLPIPIGVLIMLLLSSVRINGKSIQILKGEAKSRIKRAELNAPKFCIDATPKYIDILCHTDYSMAEKNILCIRDYDVWKGYFINFEDMSKQIFIKNSYESLLSNGLLERNSNQKLILQDSLVKLGFISKYNLTLVYKNKKTLKKRLVLFLSAKEEIEKYLLNFSKYSGTLLFFASTYNLGIGDLNA